MKTISNLLMIALFGVVAVSTTPAPQSFGDSACEYFGMNKEWCVDGAFSPEFFEHLGDSSDSRHSPGSKRDNIKRDYEWSESLMEVHDHVEFAKPAKNATLCSQPIMRFIKYLAVTVSLAATATSAAPVSETKEALPVTLDEGHLNPEAMEKRWTSARPKRIPKRSPDALPEAHLESAEG
ncbi:hypothetical protein BG015_000959 [Linnemannia schmuckeri]|uniref:Uncharacterized protein n=1 Tax=Linnemannia schmuckeri TaxID=64567 RepID=A0A9P5V7A3_9FUNG|nr:hypothetical protein BG015_000959 [Linnemannia schmuckeri]